MDNLTKRVTKYVKMNRNEKVLFTENFTVINLKSANIIFIFYFEVAIKLKFIATVIEVKREISTSGHKHYCLFTFLAENF